MIYAADIDLRKIYCVGENGRVACKGDPAFVVPPDCHLLLCEIASPVSFKRGGESSAIIYNLAKWALWNVAMVTHISNIAEFPVLVAPSNVWTKGHPLKTRHLIAGCKQPQKDLREAEAMLYFYKHTPTDWRPLGEYLQQL